LWDRSRPGAAEHAVYLAQLERYRERLERKQNSAEVKPAEMGDSSSKNAAPEMAMMDPGDEREDVESEARDLAGLSAEQRFKAFLKLPTEEQIALATSKGNIREGLMEGFDPRQRETFMALNNPQQVVTEELIDGKLLRAIYSERQLQEVMTDFWFNHFNVFIGKGADRCWLLHGGTDMFPALSLVLADVMESDRVHREF